MTNATTTTDELPEITKIETTARVTPEEHPAVVVWFGNGAKLQYVNQNGTVYEEVFHADDPHSVYEAFDIAIEADEMKEAALESIAEYVNEYRDDPEACERDWTHIYEILRT